MDKTITVHIKLVHFKTSSNQLFISGLRQDDDDEPRGGTCYLYFYNKKQEKLVQKKVAFYTVLT